MKRYILALDLRHDDQLIQAYDDWHRNVWPEVKQSILDSGIQHMAIYRFTNRLCMLMETSDTFSFEQKASADAANTLVQEWESLMEQYQQRIPGTEAGDKWVLMDKIFELSATDI